MKAHHLFFALILALALTACKQDNEPAPIEPGDEIVTSGVVVACEGSFMLNNASFHWIGDDGTSKANLYSQANGTGPGDVLQSYREFNGRGYAVVNNSQKVDVVSASSFSLQGTITGCDYPRDVLVVDGGKGYITNGSTSGELLIFNPNNYSITGSISVGQGPEQLVSNGSFVFVANSGGWANDNTVSIVNPLTDQVVSTVTVGDRPMALQVDYQNNVWVLCIH
jgi:YVTN family beta-propeller protein